MKTVLKVFVQLIGFVLPWTVRRQMLLYVLGYEIDPSAHIGLSILLSKSAILKTGARIGHFNYIGRLDLLELREESAVIRFNWIVGSSQSDGSPFFAGKTTRKSVLVLGRGAVIMNQHLID